MTRVGLIYFVFCVSIIFSCRNDTLPDSKNDLEEIYFNDYESPMYKWGFIDEKGTVVIKPKYDDARDFQNSLAVVNFKGRWGCINNNGDVVVDFKYRQLFDFSENRSFAQDFNNNWLLIDQFSNTTAQLEYDAFKSFNNGYAPVSKNTHWGIIDKNGHLLVPLVYQSIIPFDSTHFIAKENGKYGIISFNNDKLIDFKYDKIYSIKNGIIRAKLNSDYCFFRIKDMHVSGSFKEAWDYEYHHTIVNKGGKFHLMDDSFLFIKELDFKRIEFAGEMKWKYKENGMWGLLNTKGEVLTVPQFEIINNFNSGFASIYLNGEWGYIDSNGKIFVQPFLPLVWDFNDNRVRVITSGGFNMIDTSGRFIFQSSFSELRDFKEGLARFQ